MLIEQREIKNILERRKSSKKKNSFKKRKKSPSKFEDVFLGENMSMATNNTLKFENKNRNYDKKDYLNKIKSNKIFNENKYRINKTNNKSKINDTNLKWTVIKQETNIRKSNGKNRINYQKEIEKSKFPDSSKFKKKKNRNLTNKINKENKQSFKKFTKNTPKKDILVTRNKKINYESNNLYYKTKKINFKFKKENYIIPEKIVNFNLLNKLNSNLKYFKNIPKPEDKYILILLSDGLNIKNNI